MNDAAAPVGEEQVKVLERLRQEEALLLSVLGLRGEGAGSKGGVQGSAESAGSRYACKG